MHGQQNIKKKKSVNWFKLKKNRTWTQLHARTHTHAHKIDNATY